MNNILNIIKKTLDYLATFMIIIGLIIIILHLCNIKQYVVVSGSMEPKIKTGSVVFINHNYKYDKLKENDVIAFKLKSGSVVTHRIVKITKEGIVTKGDANKKEDGITTENNYVGKLLFSIPYVGYIIKVFTTTKGIIAISMVFIMIIVLCSINLKTKKN